MNQTQLDHGSPGSTDQMFDPGRRAERVWKVSLEETIRPILIKVCQANRVETCGFVTVAGKIHVIDNVHETPKHNFLMDEDSFRVTIEQIYNVEDDAVLGIWHTHPNNVVWPTPRDLAGWPNPGLNWKYWIVTNQEVIEWKLA